MKRIFLNCLSLLIVSQVLAAPSSTLRDEQTNSIDSLEQELSRPHHSTDADKATTDTGTLTNTPEDSISVAGTVSGNSIDGEEEDGESKDDNASELTEDDLYDITVGDVIRDVLITLRDHPEIVKQLIASEKAKLEEQIDAFNYLVDDNSDGDNLAGYMEPAEQLNSVPKSVEKKSGHFGMPVTPNEDKRADEVMNEEYTPLDDDSHSEDESQEYEEFMAKPVEGGLDPNKFNFGTTFSNSDDSHSDTSSETEESDTSETSEETEDSEESESTNLWIHHKYPFLDPAQVLRKIELQNRIRQYKESSSQTTESHDSETSESEEDLDNLLPQQTDDQVQKFHQEEKRSIQM